MLKDFAQVFYKQKPGDNYIAYGSNNREHKWHYSSNNSGETSDYANREFGYSYGIFS